MDIGNAPLTLDLIEQLLDQGKIDPERLRSNPKIDAQLKRVWQPQDGPQAMAFYSEADEMLYGGAAGGGKTDLILGLALTKHERSAIYRRQSNDLEDLWGRLDEIGAPIRAKNNSNSKVYRTTDGRRIFGGHLELPGSEKSAQGRARDFYGFDEGAQLEEFKVEFVTRWNRSTTPGQRCRVVIATNPPIPEMKDGVFVDNGSGDWLIRWFAPWLDARFPHPASEGELRWCYMRRDGDRLTTVWVDGPGNYELSTGLPKPDATEDDLLSGKIVVARSRTFIRSLLKDNAFLRNSGYAQRMASTPEPLKSLLLLGRFDIKPEDHPFQVIPTNWVLQAQERWAIRRIESSRYKQLVLSADIAQGGAATTVLSKLLETNFYAELRKQPGRDTPTGREVAAMILDEREDNSLIVLDGTGGWAGATRVILEDRHQITPELCVASEKSTAWTDDMVYNFLNKRSEMWWKFREALSPKSGNEIALPPDSRLLAQLTTPMFQVKGKTLVVESKQDIMKRLQGASTDEADSVIQAWAYRDQAVAAAMDVKATWVDRVVHGKTDADIRRERQRPVDMENPLRDW